MFGWLRGRGGSTYWPRVREATSGVSRMRDGRRVESRRPSDETPERLLPVAGDGTSSPITTESSEIPREESPRGKRTDVDVSIA